MSNLGIALEITALGMGLVFAALILLWGMMSLLTASTAEKPSFGTDPADAPHSPTSDLATEEALRAQAVAVAVAMAMAEQQTSLPNTPPTANVSAWQLGMRSRQMYQKGGSMRRRSRQENR